MSDSVVCSDTTIKTLPSDFANLCAPLSAGTVRPGQEIPALRHRSTNAAAASSAEIRDRKYNHGWLVKELSERFNILTGRYPAAWSTSSPSAASAKRTPVPAAVPSACVPSTSSGIPLFLPPAPVC